MHLSVVFILLFTVGLCRGVTFSNKTIDGSLTDWSSSSELFGGSQSSQWYFSWSATYFYVALNYGTVGDNNAEKFVVLYFDTDPVNDGLYSSEGSYVGYMYNTQNATLPFKGDYHVRWTTDNSLFYIAKFNKTTGTWNSLGVNGMIAYQSGSVVEIAIPRSVLGNPERILALGSMITSTNFGERTYAFCPYDSNSSDQYYPIIRYNNYFGFALREYQQGLIPNFGGHLNTIPTWVTSTTSTVNPGYWFADQFPNQLSTVYVWPQQTLQVESTAVLGIDSIVVMPSATLTAAAGSQIQLTALGYFVANTNATITHMGTLEWLGDTQVTTTTNNTSVTFQNVLLRGAAYFSTNVGFGSVSVNIRGQLVFKLGSYIPNNNIPNYLPNSTLVYDNGVDYGRYNEWNTVTPYNVLVNYNCILDLGANWKTIPANAKGDVTVLTNSTLTMNFPGHIMSAPLYINGSFAVSNGTVILSPIAGASIFVGGSISIINSVVTCTNSTNNIYSSTTGLAWNAPVISGNTVIDVNVTTTLDAGAGYVSYLWSDNSTNRFLVVSTNGTYSVTIKDSGGCIATQKVTVTYSPPIIPTTGQVSTTSSTTSPTTSAVSGSTSSSTGSDNIATPSDSDNNILIIAIVVPVGVFFLLLLLILLIVLIRRRNRTPRDEPLQMNAVESQSNENQKKDKPLQDSSVYNPLPEREGNVRLAKSTSSTRLKEPAEIVASWEIDLKELEYEGKIGEGAYGVVFKGKYRSTPVAIKQLKESSSWKQDKLEQFRREAQLMLNIRNHTNIVLLCGICSTKTPYLIITEYYSRGSLLQYLRSTEDIPLDRAMEIVRGIARGMLHLHSENVIHRDLAARNILLTENFQAKISDFGYSRLLTSSDDSGSTESNVGPVKWMAPECISERLFSTKSDIWAFGVLLVEIYTREEPYPGIHLLEVATKVTSGKLKPAIPDSAPVVIKEIMADCFLYEPDARPDMKFICKKLEGN